MVGSACSGGMRLPRAQIAIRWLAFLSLFVNGCRTERSDAPLDPFLRRGQVVVRLPDGLATDTIVTRAIIDAVLAQPAPVGFPRDWELDGVIIIRLTAGDWSEAEGRAVVDANSIELPYPAALHWSTAKMARVIRHELVHIALAAYLTNEYLPLWLDEGFAEWEAGALGGNLTLRLEMQGALKDSSWPPPLLSLGRSRVDYDLAATFIEYIDQQSHGGVRSTEFLASVRDLGVYRSFPKVVGTEFSDVERDWHRYVHRTYGARDDTVIGRVVSLNLCKSG